MSKRRVVHFSDGLGPVCGIASEHSIGPRSPKFPIGVSCSKCLKKIAVMAKALMQFKDSVQDARMLKPSKATNKQQLEGVETR